MMATALNLCFNLTVLPHSIVHLIFPNQSTIMSSGHHAVPVPPGPCLVLDPDDPDQRRGTILLDSKGDRLACDMQPLGGSTTTSFVLTWRLARLHTLLFRSKQSLHLLPSRPSDPEQNRAARLCSPLAESVPVCSVRQAYQRWMRRISRVSGTAVSAARCVSGSGTTTTSKGWFGRR
jgi:hypothetical protein